MDDWPFYDPPNVAVFSTRSILDQTYLVYYVSHDGEDGAWQFMPRNGPVSMENAAIVGLKTMLRLEPAIAELSDLPLGWCAWRENKDDTWKRKIKE